MSVETSSRAPLPPEIFLRAEGLVKKFGDFVAVNGVSFDVRHDTDPLPGFEPTDTTTKFSLVYKIE